MASVKLTEGGAIIKLAITLAGIIFLPIVGPFICFKKFTKRHERHDCGNGYCRTTLKELVEKNKKNQPRPLPSTRRAISPGPTRGRLRSRIGTQKTKCDKQGQLLRLPLEIREQLLLEVLGGSIIHLIQCQRRLGHIRCKERGDRFALHHAEEPHYDAGRECIPISARRTYDVNDLMESASHRKSYPSSENCLSLIRTCRQLYNEGVKVLYSTNTFDINNPETLMFLAQTIRPNRLAAIKYLQICVEEPRLAIGGHYNIPGSKEYFQAWVDSWKMVGSKMTGLQSLVLQLDVLQLQVDFVWSPLRNNRQHIESLLEAVKTSEISGLRSFDLKITGLDNVQLVGKLEQDLRRILCN